MLEVTLAKFKDKQWNLWLAWRRTYCHVRSECYRPHELGEHRDDACSRQRERA